MKILFVPSYSMRSYTRNQWLLTRDGHYNQTLAWIKYLAKDFLLNTKDVDVVVPAKSDIEFLGQGYNPLVHFGYKQNIHEQRQDTGYQELFKDKGHYDLIINGYPEYAEFFAEKFPGAKLVTILTHGPLITDKYLLDNSNGLLASDAVLFIFAESLITKHLGELPSNFHPMYNYVDADLDSWRDPTEQDDKVLFLSRLTDPTRFDVPKLTALLQDVSRYREVSYTDPTNSGEVIRGLKYRSQNSRAEYLTLLDSVGTIVLPYQVEQVYSISYFEALAMGKSVITFKHSEHFKDLNTESSIDSLDELEIALEHGATVPRKKAAKYLVDRMWIGKLYRAIFSNDWEEYLQHYAD